MTTKIKVGWQFWFFIACLGVIPNAIGAAIYIWRHLSVM